ncbi:MAG: IS66 family insertion sequence element accessory protein TnpB [Planctomycetes bacterium]|nr:IS66 family insertion sequence element accessory protein TnpB [Planctomycetota bacterium]
MLSLPPAVRIYLAAGSTDLRKSFDGLRGLARSVVGANPLSGHLFAFCNRGLNRAKVLYWDTTGLCKIHKRLERGSFSWPPEGCSRASVEEEDARELALLLSGLDLATTQRRKWSERRTGAS